MSNNIEEALIHLKLVDTIDQDINFSVGIAGAVGKLQNDVKLLEKKVELLIAENQKLASQVESQKKSNESSMHAKDFTTFPPRSKIETGTEPGKVSKLRNSI